MTCANCGNPLPIRQQPPQMPGVQQPPQQQYGGVPPPPTPPAAQPYYAQPVAAIQNYMTHNIVMAVLSPFFCCNFVSLAIAIVGIVFASNSSKSAAQGDINGAQNAANTAKILFLVSLSFFVLGIFGFIVKMIVGGGLQALRMFPHMRV